MNHTGRRVKNFTIFFISFGYLGGITSCQYVTHSKNGTSAPNNSTRVRNGLISNTLSGYPTHFTSCDNTPAEKNGGGEIARISPDPWASSLLALLSLAFVAVRCNHRLRPPSSGASYATAQGSFSFLMAALQNTPARVFAAL